MARLQAESRINFDLQIPDAVWEEWEKFKAFREGDRYALPDSYLKDPRRGLIFPDPSGPSCQPITASILSEEILQWDFSSRRLRTAVYTVGLFKRGLTFDNPNPWGQRSEAVAVRSIDLGKFGEETITIKPSVDIPIALVGDKARSLAVDYKAAVWTKDRHSRWRIGREVKEKFGLELVMVGVNGPNFRLCEVS